MQLVGIGLASSNWNSLVKQFQKQLHHQLNTKTLGTLNSTQNPVILSKYAAENINKILKLKPDWLIFSVDSFETPELCLRFLQEIKNKSKKDVHLVMALDNLNHDLTELLKLQPVFELVNKMQFKISEPELLLTHHIRSFPRIRLDADFLTMDYTNHTGTLVRQSPGDVPLKTLIPFSKIEKFETKNGDLSPHDWLDEFLLSQDSQAHPEQVVGILREAKGCYLFPGIPFNSIQSLKFDESKIDHVIRLDECSTKNPPFKRFIENMKQEHQDWLKIKKQKAKLAAVRIYCLGKYPIINNLLQNLLQEMGYTNFTLISNNSVPDLQHKEERIYIKLNNLAGTKIPKQHLDWSQDLNQILDPLNHFVFLHDLQLDSKYELLPLQQTEFEDLRNNLLSKEKTLDKTIQQAESDQMLYTQEHKILKNIVPFSELVLESLSTCSNWEHAFENAAEQKRNRALLLCEDETSAAEMNASLTKIQRKLWINPFKFQHTEDLTQFNTKAIQPYLKAETIIATTTARTHLEKLCREALLNNKNAEIIINELKQQRKQLTASLESVQNKKSKLALRWLHVSLKQLLYRDRHLFQSLPGKAE